MRLLIISTALTIALIGKSQQSITALYDYRGSWAPLSSDGTVVDTPEVARARTAHLAAHEATAARLAKIQTKLLSTTKSDTMTELPSEMGHLMTNTPVILQADNQRSTAPLGKDGWVVDTPEVAVAKAKHLAAHARAAATRTSDYKFDAYKHTLGNLLYLIPIRSVSSIYGESPVSLESDDLVIDTPEMARTPDMKTHARAIALTLH